MPPIPRCPQRGRRRRRRWSGVFVATGLVATATSSVGGGAATAATTLSLQQWSRTYLTYIGAPAKNANDPRVLFLEKWAAVEGTFYLGNEFNPLDTELYLPDAGLWNTQGVRTFPSLELGYQATLATMSQIYDQPVLAALENRRSSLATLTSALAASNWTGGGPNSPSESGYAHTVGTESLAYTNPDRQATVSLGRGAWWSYGQIEFGPADATVRGTVVSPRGTAVSGVCVVGFSAHHAPVTSVTTAAGEFRLTGLPQSDAVIELVDCNATAGGAAAIYYDADTSHKATTSWRAATTLHLGVLAHQRIDRIVYGTVAPLVSWPAPGAIAYGTALSSSQLDATASVRGKFSYSPAAGTLVRAGTSQLSVTFTPANTKSFHSVQATVPITVDRATPPISWPSPAAIAYGTPLGGSQLDATSSVPGAFSYPSNLGGTVLGGGAHSLQVTFTPSDSTDYQSAVGTTTLQVNPSAPALSVTPVASLVPGTTLSSSAVSVQASVPGSYSYSPPMGSTVDAGTEDLAVTFTPDDTTDYAPTTKLVAIPVDRLVPQVTWPTPLPVAAGSTLSPAQLDATASVPGTFTYSPSAGTAVASPGFETLSVTFTPSDGAAYVPVTSTVQLSVRAPVAPAIAWPQPAPVAAGSVLSSAQLDATASVPGTFTYSPPAGTVLSAGTTELTASFTPSVAGYLSSIVSTTLTVLAPQTPTVTWATPSPVAAGSVLSSAQLDATASVPGTFTYSPAAGSVVGDAAETLSVTFTPANAAAYLPVTVTTTLAVT